MATDVPGLFSHSFLLRPRVLPIKVMAPCTPGIVLRSKYVLPGIIVQGTCGCTAHVVPSGCGARKPGVVFGQVQAATKMAEIAKHKQKKHIHIINKREMGECKERFFIGHPCSG